MSNRLIQPVSSISTGTNNFVDYRNFETAPAQGKNLRAGFGGTVVSSSRVENVTVGIRPHTFCYSILTNLSGTGNDQSSATQTVATFQDALNDRTFWGPDGTQWATIWKLNAGLTAFVPGTYADFTAQGGSIGTNAASIPVINMVQGFIIFSDIFTGVSLEKGASFAHQSNVTAAVSTAGAYLGYIRGNGVSDATKAGTSFAAGGFQLKNWSSLSGRSTAITPCFGPLMLIGENAYGAETVFVCGDSIAAGSPGDDFSASARLYATGYVRASLAVAGYPTIGAAVPSTTATQFNAGAQPCAMFLASFCTSMAHEYGTNEIGNASLISVNQTFCTTIRGALRGRKRIVAFDLLPKQNYGSNGQIVAPLAITSGSASGTTATILVASTTGISNGTPIQLNDTGISGWNGVTTVTSFVANTSITCPLPGGASGLGPISAGTITTRQTNASTKSTPAYQTYIRRTGAYSGVAFNRAAGDPDAGISAYDAIGGTQTVEGFYASRADTVEGTHPVGNPASGPTGTAIATAVAAIVPQLASALGFSPV